MSEDKSWIMRPARSVHGRVLFLFGCILMALRWFAAAAVMGQDIVQRIAAIPLAAGLLNLIKDGIILLLVHDLPHQSTGLAALSGYLTMFKTITISASLIALIVLCFFILSDLSQEPAIVSQFEEHTFQNLRI